MKSILPLSNQWKNSKSNIGLMLVLFIKGQNPLMRETPKVLITTFISKVLKGPRLIAVPN
jgi:hypothetical protein